MKSNKNQPQINLTSAQQQAIDDNNSRFQIIACAGSGKTEVVSRRITRWLKEGADPKSIVAFTFTEKAASELKARIYRHVEEEMGKEQVLKLGPLYAGTIHSYCLRLMQDYTKELANYETIDEHRQVALMLREHKRWKLKEKFPQIKKTFELIHTFSKNIDVYYNELLSTTDLEKQGNTVFQSALADFEGTLHHYRVMTYGQIIAYAVKRLKNDGNMLSKIHDQLKYLVVDEYQDINNAQDELIKLLVSGSADLTVVGDDDQAIYQWRGSSVSSIVEFKEHYQAESVDLMDNHRSRPGIINKSNHIAAGIENRLPKKMNPSRDEVLGDVCIWEAETPSDEAKAITETIAKLYAQGYKYSDMAVLCRSVKTSGQPIMNAFRESGIPFSAKGRSGLFQHAEIVFFSMTYAFLADCQWTSDQYSYGEKISLKTLKEQFKRTPFANFKSEEKVMHYLESKQKAIAEGSQIDAVGEYYQLLKIMGTPQLDPKDNNDLAVLERCARFSCILTDFEHMTRRARPDNMEEKREKDIVKEEAKVNEPTLRFVHSQYFYQRLTTYIQWYASGSYDETNGNHKSEEDAVQIMTIHQSKGLEFPVVFVPGMVKQRFPSKNTGKKQTWFISKELFDAGRYEGTINDEKRLFYVAITRAKETLYVSRFRRQKNKTGMSPFFEELLENNKPLDYSDGGIPLPDTITSSSKKSEKIKEFTVTDLLTYETCPYGYQLRHEMEFQPPMALALGYGKIVHFILHLLAMNAKETGQVPTVSHLKEVMDKYFYLPFANRAAFRQMKRAVDGNLTHFIKEKGQNFLKIKESERRFNLSINDFTITGKADVVIDGSAGDDAVTLVDYKTGLDKEDLDSMESYATQLQLYAAAGRQEGINTIAATIYDLHNKKPHNVEISPATESKAIKKAGQLSQGIATGSFDARIGQNCKKCDVKDICKYSN